MDEDRFDQLARDLFEGGPSRRGVLRLLAAGTATVCARFGRADDAFAKCTKLGKWCEKGDKCCAGGKCKRGKCRCGRGTRDLGGVCCDRDEELCGDRCVRCINGTLTPDCACDCGPNGGICDSLPGQCLFCVDPFRLDTATCGCCLPPGQACRAGQACCGSDQSCPEGGAICA